MGDLGSQFEFEDNSGSSNIFNQTVPATGTVNVPSSPGPIISGFMILNKSKNRLVQVRWTGETNWLFIYPEERVFMNIRGEPTQLTFQTTTSNTADIDIVLYRQDP